MTERKARQQQIPFRNGRKKSKGNSRFPPGMTERKARQQQIPFRNDRKKSKATADSLQE
jgi:hypothetical protein